jgi:hypothetical protein
LIHLQIDWTVNDHRYKYLDYRFRPFGLFRKSTHSSIGEESPLGTRL